MFLWCCFVSQVDVLSALLAVVKVLLGEHVELTVQPACFVPQQLSLALQTVQQLNLAVHVSDLILEVLTGDVHLLAELSKHTRQLLLDLVAAVRSSVTNNELQLLAGVVHKLSLEGSLLGLCGPSEPLVDIEEAIQTK